MEDNGYYRALVLDAMAVTAVAGLLVAIHVLLPPGVRDEFALQYDQPDPLHAFTAAYVHHGDAHLRGNIAGLLAGGAWALLVSHLAGERRWFRFSFLWFLTVLPIAVGLTGAWLFSEPLTTRGFSGIVAGFAGFGIVGVAVVLHREFGIDQWLARDVAAALVVVIGAEILWLITGTVSKAAPGLLLVAVALTGVPVVRAGLLTGLPTDRPGWSRLVRIVLTIILLGLLAVVFVAGLFPRDIAGDGPPTNVLGHYLGMVYGAIIASWGYRYWSQEGSNRRS